MGECKGVHSDEGAETKNDSSSQHCPQKSGTSPKEMSMVSSVVQVKIYNFLDVLAALEPI